MASQELRRTSRLTCAALATRWFPLLMRIFCITFKQGTDLIDLRGLLEGVIFGMDPFGSLGGRYGLQTASEVRSVLRFEISDLDYLHIHVHIVYMAWTLLTASEATTASKQPRRSDLTSD